MKRITVISGLLLLALAVAACGGGGGGGGGNTVPVTIKGTDAFTFDPPKLEVNKGDTVKVTLQNTGAQVHDIVIADVKLNLVAQPGKSATAEFKADKAGTFEFHCSQPGHKEGGMKGQLVVKG